MKNLKQSMSLRKKILISCVGCMISALVLQTIIFQNSSSGIIVGQTRQITKNTLESLQGDLHTYIKNIEYDMIKIYNNKKVAIKTSPCHKYEIL